VRPALLRSLFARTRREMVEGAACGALNAPILCVSIPLAVRRLGGWSLHPVVLPSGPITGARHGCSAQAGIRNNRNTPSAPAKWTLCMQTLAWGRTGLAAAAFAYHRTSAVCTVEEGRAVSECMQVLPIVRYGHMLMTADLPARDTAALLPIVAQNSSTRVGWKCHALEKSDVKPFMLSITAILIAAEGPA
jgi:hypothetical protein